jgi:multimeric flavodoxin WrbA
MKLLGLTCGRKLQNNEILMKEALMEAKGFGIDVAMIRLLELNLKPCQGCMACAFSLMNGGPGDCVIKDDLPFLDEQIMECDGLILAAPVFILGPHGIVKLIADRMGPSHDVAWRMEAKKIREGSDKPAGKGPDERSFKKRVAGFISVGGATTPNWLSFGLPLMHLFAFPSHIVVVDQMQVCGMTTFMNMVLNPEALKRARKLGRNVAMAMKKPMEEVTWMGDEPGTCPVCHSNLLTVTKRNPVECPICGIKGTLRTNGDEITVTFSEEEQKRSRLTLAGKLEHWNELQDNFRIFMQRPDKDDIIEKSEKYRSQEYESFVLTPLRKEKG